MKTFLIISSEKGKTKTVKITAENSEIAINSFKNGRPGVSVTAIYEARESDFLRYATGENLGQFVRIKQQPQDLKITVNTQKNPYITGYGKKVPTMHAIKSHTGHWLRVYCQIFSNIGTCWVHAFGGYRVIVEI